MNVEDPIAVLSELAEQAMRRLGADFKVSVGGDYRKFPLTLTIKVEEYGEETEVVERGWEKTLKRKVEEHGEKAEEENVLPNKDLFLSEGEEWEESDALSTDQDV